MTGKVFVFSLTFIAAVMDYRSMRISNRVILAGLAMGVIYDLLTGGKEMLRYGLLGMLIPLVMLFAFFVLRLLGAADIKLFSVLGMFMGPVSIIRCMFYSFVFGALFAIIKLVISRKENDRRIIRFAIPIFLSVLLYVGGFY